MARVRVLLFATAREAAGRGRLELTIPEAGARVDAVLEELRDRYPRLAPVLATSRIFVNGESVARRTAPLAPDDELAIHPPYSGG